MNYYVGYTVYKDVLVRAKNIEEAWKILYGVFNKEAIELKAATPEQIQNMKKESQVLSSKST